MSDVPLPRTGIDCCNGCRSRSADPSCHSYCPTYLAAKMEHDARAKAEKQRAGIMGGLSDQRERGCRKSSKRRRKR